VKDPLAIGLGALLTGIGLGAAVITAALIIVLFTERSSTGNASATGDVLFISLLGGIAVAALFGWRRSRALDNLWQRGVIAVLAPFGALTVVFLLTIPARQLLGLAGLAILLVLTVAGGVAGSRWAMRGTGESGTEGGTP
jgi:hypothetical protein